jgi:heptosyltransferase-2
MTSDSTHVTIPAKNVVIRMPNWLGDLVMATPLLEDLRRLFPTSRLTAMCQSNTAALLQHDPHVDEVFSFQRANRWLHRQENHDVFRKLRQGNYDVGVLCTNSFSSAWWFWRGHIPKRVGFATHKRSWLLSDPLPLPEGYEIQHQVQTYKELLRPLGAKPSDSSPSLYVSHQEQEEAWDLLGRLGISREHIVVGINPGAQYGSAKCWLPSRFRHVTQNLLENPLVRVLYFGDQHGRSLVQEICMGLPKRVVNLAGETSIRELMALIKVCDIFLTNDSGPMHIASALGTPLVALFGSTSDVRTGPYVGGRVLHKHVECSPCYKRTCPIDMRCMTRIGVEEVYAELQ